MKALIVLGVLVIVGVIVGATRFCMHIAFSRRHIAKSLKAQHKEDVARESRYEERRKGLEEKEKVNFKEK